jgi:IS5 family transposase
MAERQIGQSSFTDGLVNDAARSNAALQRVSELVDWSEVEALLSGLRSGSMGAPGYPSLALFKALLLQQWHGLSDPGFEEWLTDCRSGAF